MECEPRGEAERRSADAAAIWRRRMARIQQRLRRAEDTLEQAASAFDRLVDDLDAGAAPTLSRGKRRPLVRRPLPTACEFGVTGASRVRFVVHGVDFHVEFNSSRFQTRRRALGLDLIALLAMDTTRGADGLVAFKSIAGLVHTLRARGFRATRRSLTVEVSRLRVALGEINRDLIETRKGAGYRFRLRSAQT